MTQIVCRQRLSKLAEKKHSNMMCFAETQIDLTILIWALCPVRVTEDIFMSDIYKDISPFPKPIVIPQNVSYPSYLTTMPYQADKYHQCYSIVPNISHMYYMYLSRIYQIYQ